jgi:hypothetical protein
MRKALNSNPVVQIGLLGVLGVLVAVVFMSNMSGEEPPPPAEDQAATETAAPAAAAPVTPAPATAAPAAPAPEATSPTVAASSAEFEASKGLPKEIVEAYESGDVVVLLVLKKKGFEDRAMFNLLGKPGETIRGADLGWSDRYESGPSTFKATAPTTLFVAKSKHVAAFSRIAEGVSLDRVPAIIVIRPLDDKLPKGEAAPMPEASVTYGYRGPESVIQAVEDMLFEGKTGGYAPWTPADSGKK